ncbi:MAG TPA: TetR family transcriptional regulator [Thiohalobacter sp.]|nr:TetR family transcriptional regulator [Thiohalobacter sp.]
MNVRSSLGAWILLLQTNLSAPPRLPNWCWGAALNLFTEQGYFNTSIRDIVRAASVSTGSLYHHFRGKEGIARSLYDTLLEEVPEIIATGPGTLTDISAWYDRTGHNLLESGESDGMIVLCQKGLMLTSCAGGVCITHPTCPR